MTTRKNTKPNYAGLREWHRSHETGFMVGVYDGIEADLDTEAGRWQTVCEEHSTICSHATLALARYQAGDPASWCEPCAAEIGS